jgi:FAD/FMN-containing dehydrogenase
MNTSTIIAILGWFGSVSIFAGLYGVAHKRRKAFFFSFFGEAAWLVKSTYIQAWDLFAMTLAFAVLAAYGYWAWGEEERKAKRAERDEQRQRFDRVRQADAANDARIKRENLKEYINGERAAMGQKPIDDVLDDVKENPEKYRVAWLNEQGEEVQLTAYEKHIAMQYLASLALAGANGKVTLAQIAAARKGASY